MQLPILIIFGLIVVGFFHLFYKYRKYLKTINGKTKEEVAEELIDNNLFHQTLVWMLFTVIAIVMVSLK